MSHLLIDAILQDELVEQSSQGSFVSQGREDILSTAIGRPEHGGRVRGVGGSWGLRDYFGAPSRRTHESCTEETVQRMVQEQLGLLRQSLQQELEEQFTQKLEALARSQQQSCTMVPDEIIRVSTKGSCTPNASTETHTNLLNMCELFVEGDPPRRVAYGRVFEGGLTIHGVPLQPDWTRVVVDEVEDADALVPIPNTEVQLVGQAIGSFLAWPRHLVMPPAARNKVQ